MSENPIHGYHVSPEINVAANLLLKQIERLALSEAKLLTENKDLKEAKIERISMLNKVTKRAGEDNELIIKLQAQLEKLRWIPVTERLPGKCKKIHPKQSDYMHFLRDDKKIVEAYYDFYWKSWYCECEGVKVSGTHWKPIIQPHRRGRNDRRRT